MNNFKRVNYILKSIEFNKSNVLKMIHAGIYLGLVALFSTPTIINAFEQNNKFHVDEAPEASIKDFYIGMSQSDIENIVVEDDPNTIGDEYKVTCDNTHRDISGTHFLLVPRLETLWDTMCYAQYYKIANETFIVTILLFNDKAWKIIFEDQIGSTFFDDALVGKFGKPNKTRMEEVLRGQYFEVKIWNIGEITIELGGTVTLFSNSALKEVERRKSETVKKAGGNI